VSDFGHEVIVGRLGHDPASFWYVFQEHILFYPDGSPATPIRSHAVLS